MVGYTTPGSLCDCGGALYQKEDRLICASCFKDWGPWPPVEQEEVIMNNHCVAINNEVFEVLPKREYSKEEEKLFDLIWRIFVAEQWANYFKAALNRMET